MPCYDDGAQTRIRDYYTKTAQYIVYVYEKLGKEIRPKLAKEAVDGSYNSDLVPELCKAIKSMDSETRERIVYDAHSKVARGLADWREEHQEEDRLREEREAKQKKK